MAHNNLIASMYPDVFVPPVGVEPGIEPVGPEVVLAHKPRALGERTVFLMVVAIPARRRGKQARRGPEDADC